MAGNQLQRYFEHFLGRLRQVQWLRALAAMLLSVLLISLIVVTYASRTGFPPAVIEFGRIALIAGMLGAFVLVGLLPIRRLRQRGVLEIEQRTPALAGRAETYTQMRAAGKHPFDDLLAEETYAIAARFPPQRQVPAAALRTPALIAAALAGLIVWFSVAGPGTYGHGFRHLYAGWLVKDLLPAQQLNVTPGDEAIRRGASVRFNARAAGFAPDRAVLHVNLGEGGWQELPMTPLADTSFDFTLYSVQNAVSYFVQAESVRSPTFSIDVVDLPDIENLRLTYFYPEWTDREPEIIEPGGDIRALAGTEVELLVETGQPLPSPAIVFNDRVLELTSRGNEASVRFRIETEGQYFVGAMLGNEQVRLSDDYFISLIEDRAPKISFTKPGRDWKASNIEEVTARLRAEDDFGVAELAVNYSVNGGDWQSVELNAATAAAAQHIFYLESLAAEQGTSLEPGDLIAYYAEAADRDQKARTDMFFIEVQPFDQRFTQSQQGGGGAGGGELGDEISARQREIIVSTWNLLREQSEPNGAAAGYISDNARLLADLQATLRTQAETLAERARARQLADDDDIGKFVGHLENAVRAMLPASERLADIEFQAALLPEQEALQHLLRAEAVFRDINVSMQQPGASGGGGQAGRDLSEMFEMEMDLEKNQYETGSTAQTDSPEQALDEIAEKLKALAERQQQLNDRIAGQNQATPEERWQQEMLRRETEELQRELEQLQRSSSQSASNSETAGGQSSTGGENAPNNGERNAENQESDASQQQAELERRVDSALRAMREASDALNNSANDTAASAAEEAQRQLQGASQEARAASNRALQESLQDMRSRAADLFERQRAIEREIQQGVAAELSGEQETALSFEAERDIALRKRALHSELEKLEQEMRGTARELDRDSQGISDALRDGIESVSEQRIKERLALSALYVEQGEARYIASSESMISESLRELRDALNEANARSAGRRPDSSEPSLNDALNAAQRLRAALDEMQDSGNQSNQTAERNSPQDSNTAGTTRESDEPSRSQSDDARGALAEQRDQTVQALRAALNGREGDTLDPESRRQLSALRRELLASDPERVGNLLDSETNELRLISERLELALRDAMRAEDAAIRSANPELIPQEHRESVAEYYRRLANDSISPSSSVPE